jgi:hypothetical protein
MFISLSTPVIISSLIQKRIKSLACAQIDAMIGAPPVFRLKSFNYLVKQDAAEVLGVLLNC